MKKTLSILAALSIAGAAFGAALLSPKHVLQADALHEGDVEWDYMAVDGNNFEVIGGNINDWITGRTGTFWNLRSFNALDNFYDGFHNEGWTGTVRSASWKQTKRYVTFTLGGNANHYVRIKKKSDGSTVATIQNTYFNDPKLCENMLVRVVDLNSYINESLYLEIEDNTTGGFGATTFGALKVSQSAEDVARTISVHKNHLSKRAGENENNADSASRTFTLDIYANNAEWTAFDSVELTDANMDFEDYDQLTNLALDTASVKGFADRGDGFDSINWAYGEAYNTADSWGWDEHMPFNKQGSAFFLGNYGGDGARYTLLTNDFKFSGTGYFSIKLAGNGTKVALIDASNGNELVSATNTNYQDGDKWNVPQNKTYTCTMTRYIIDAREHLNKTVRIAISDDSTAGWSILMFDELKTKYDTIPVFSLDTYTQTPKDQAPRYGIVPSVLVQTNTGAVKEAYDFIQSYFSVFREEGSFKYLECSGFTSVQLQKLCDDYDDLSSDAKAIVAASDDYDRGSVAGDYYFLPVNTSNKIGTIVGSIISKNNLVPTGSGSSSLAGTVARESNAVVLIIVASISTIALLGLVFLFKKRKAN